MICRNPKITNDINCRPNIQTSGTDLQVYFIGNEESNKLNNPHQYKNVDISSSHFKTSHVGFLMVHFVGN